MGLLKDLSLLLLVRGRDERAPYERAIEKLGLTGMVRFLDRLPDVVQFYAAADLYVGPSLYDSFAIPVAEAMACGLPVIASIQAGVSEIVTDGENGFILRDPKDVEGLAEKIRLLYEDTDMCSRLGQKAAQTISQFTWERNALQIQTLLGKALSQKQQVCGWLKERMG
jgi:UDP-glucose:(heptosyl)LPS alpha-1,3-glucosyltransferase